MTRFAWSAISVALATGSLSTCDLSPTAPPLSEQMTLVGADRQGRIYIVDESSGATTLLDTAYMQLPFADPITFAPFPPVPVGAVTGMTWVPSSGRWWLALGARRSLCPNCIFSYDPAADSARLVRRYIAEVDTLTDFAVHPANHRIYTFKEGQSGYLFRVEASTGEFFEVLRGLDEGSYGKGATFSSDGLLYVAGGDKLTRIRLSRAEVTVVGTLAYIGFPTFTNYSVAIAALATRTSDGAVLALVEDGGGMAGTVTGTYLATVDLETAVVSYVAATASPLSSLAYVPTRLVD